MALWQPLRDVVGRPEVESADCAPSSDRGNGARANVTSDAATDAEDAHDECYIGRSLQKSRYSQLYGTWGAVRAGKPWWVLWEGTRQG